MQQELTVSQLRDKYGDIEGKVPSQWHSYEAAGVELARDLAFTWDLQDAELIRVIAAIAQRVPSLNLAKHTDPRFAFAGLYPNVMKSLEIQPESHGG